MSQNSVLIGDIRRRLTLPRKVRKKIYRIEVLKDGRWIEACPRMGDIDLASVKVYKLSKRYGYRYGVDIRVVEQDL